MILKPIKIYMVIRPNHFQVRIHIILVVVVVVVVAAVVLTLKKNKSSLIITFPSRRSDGTAIFFQG